jgi:macrodomain Ter protein organizer (MatP/YcbG family)
MEQKSSEEIKAEMDKAALEAVKELKKLDKKALVEVGEWIKKHYLKAGYKRLCKALLAEIK